MYYLDRPIIHILTLCIIKTPKYSDYTVYFSSYWQIPGIRLSTHMNELFDCGSLWYAARENMLSLIMVWLWWQRLIPSFTRHPQTANTTELQLNSPEPLKARYTKAAKITTHQFVISIGLNLCLCVEMRKYTSKIIRILPWTTNRTRPLQSRSKTVW